MKYISLFSGVGSESIAWQKLEWECLAHCENDPHASAILDYHYSNIPNLDDVTQVDWQQYQGCVDLMIGGSPCQDFSVAGLRAGMTGDRGNLTLEYVNAIRTVKPRFFLWENVPGVLSDKANAFGSLLAGLLGEDCPLSPPESGKWDNAGFFISEECAIAYRILNSQFFGVPQRRRRVFLVGLNFRDCGGMATKKWGDLSGLAGIPAAILFEPDCQGGDTEESESPWEDTAPDSGGGTESVVFNPGAYSFPVSQMNQPAPTLNTAQGGCREHMIAYRVGSYESNSMKSDNPYSGIYQTAIATTLRCNSANPASNQGGDLICFSPNDHGQDCGFVSPTLRSAGHKDSHANAGAPPAIAKCLTSRNERNDYETENFIVDSQYEVRKLTPIECERLQGYPDGWTDVPYKGKPMTKGARYKMCGNGITANVLDWLGNRIELITSAILYR